MLPAHRTVVLSNAALGFLLNLPLNAALAWVTFPPLPTMPLWARGPCVGFDTIGNATIIAYDRGPVLATDPWLGGAAYFGSWGLSHPIPEAQREAILARLLFATVTDAVTNFSADRFALDTALFSNDLAGGVFTLEAVPFQLRFTPNRAPVANALTNSRATSRAVASVACSTP